MADEPDVTTGNESEPSLKTEDSDARTGMLLAMYSEMWANINRHITLVWQSVGTVVGTLAVVAFVGEDFLSVDAGASVIVILAAWELAHVIDASGWNNRNLFIIRNIERTLLSASDARLIHPYFVGPPRSGGMVEQLRIQFLLGLTFGVGALVYHFTVRLWPSFPHESPTLRAATLLPYVLAAGSAVGLALFVRYIRSEYKKLTELAPGAEATH